MVRHQAPSPVRGSVGCTAASPSSLQLSLLLGTPYLSRLLSCCSSYQYKSDTPQPKHVHFLRVLAQHTSRHSFLCDGSLHIVVVIIVAPLWHSRSCGGGVVVGVGSRRRSHTAGEPADQRPRHHHCRTVVVRDPARQWPLGPLDPRLVRWALSLTQRTHTRSHTSADRRIHAHRLEAVIPADFNGTFTYAAQASLDYQPSSDQPRVNVMTLDLDLSTTSAIAIKRYTAAVFLTHATVYCSRRADRLRHEHSCLLELQHHRPRCVEPHRNVRTPHSSMHTPHRRQDRHLVAAGQLHRRGGSPRGCGSQRVSHSRCSCVSITHISRASSRLNQTIELASHSHTHSGRSTNDQRRRVSPIKARRTRSRTSALRRSAPSCCPSSIRSSRATTSTSLSRISRPMISRGCVSLRARQQSINQSLTCSLSLSVVCWRTNAVDGRRLHIRCIMPVRLEGQPSCMLPFIHPSIRSHTLHISLSCL